MRTLPAMLMDQAARQGARLESRRQAEHWNMARRRRTRRALRCWPPMACPGRPRGADGGQPDRVPVGGAGLRLAGRGGGADQYRVAGMQLRHILENSACVLLVADAASCAGAGDGGWRRPGPARDLAAGRRCAAGGAGAARAPAGGAPRAPEASNRPTWGRATCWPSCTPPAHPACPGRVLSACAILVVGPDRRAQPGDPRRGRALHQPAAVPHQCVERLFPGAGDGASIVCDERFSVSRYFDRQADRRHGDLPAGRDGAHAAGARARAGRTPPRAHRAGAGRARALSRRIPAPHRIGAAGRLRLHRDQFRAGRGAGRAARAPWAGSRPSSRPAWPTSTTRRCRTASPASCCCGRARLTPSPPAASPWRTRRSRPGATCGSTPATGWCATPTATTASWTA